MHPSLKGRAQIEEFYTKTIGRMKPHVIAVAYTGDDHQCMVELANRFEHNGRTALPLSLYRSLHLARGWQSREHGRFRPATLVSAAEATRSVEEGAVVRFVRK